MTGSTANVPDLQPGTPVGEYVVKRKIGEGGMGQVYAGEQPMIGKQVAIKVLSSQLIQDPSLVQRMLDEARAVNLIHHPNLIDIFSFGMLPDRRPYFVMEYLEGEDLETALGRNAVTPADLTSLIEQLCQTLGAAHAAGFVHRDLKPENLWLQRKPDGTPFLKVLDFGIAKNMRMDSPGLTTHGQVLGTAHYMAPEQALARAIDGRTDIYAIGVILYRIFAGVLPFDDPNIYTVVTKHITEQPRPISFHRRLPADVERVVMRCLSKDPAQRPQTVSQLWGEIRPALAAWQAADSAAGLAATMCTPAQTAAIAATTMPESTHGFNAGSRATIQPVARAQTRQAPRRGGRLMGASLAASVVIVGGIGLYVSFLGPRSGSPRPAAAPLSSSYDSAPLRPTFSATPLPPIPPRAIQGGRDSGAGASTSPPSAPQAPRPSKKVSRDHGDPIRL
jgi:tRNA A-37 threonylcarbamoyl transferase component Bud32